jgi:MSHA biogenesis protein MshK
MQNILIKPHPRRRRTTARCAVSAGLCVVLLSLAAPAPAQLEDPTRPPPSLATPPAPPAEDKVGETSWVLSSILISPSRRLAVINGRTLAPGDKLGDAVVREIRPSGVRLQRGDETVTLPLLPAPVKAPRHAGEQSE